MGLIRNSFSDVTKSLAFFFLSFLCLFFISHFLVEIKVAFNEFYFDALTKISRRPDFSKDFVVVDSTELQFSTPIERERSFQDLLKKIKEDKPRLIYFILANSSLIQEFSYFKNFKSFISSNKNSYFGVTSSYGFSFLSEKKIPVLNLKENRIFKREVIRTYPLLEDEGEGLSFSLETLIREDKGEDFFDEWKKDLFHEANKNIFKKDSFLINYYNEKSLKVIFLKDLEKEKSSFSGKIIFVGSSKFLKTSVSFGQGSFFNTPWNGDESPEELGRPLVFLYPNIASNLLRKDYIRHDEFFSHIGMQFLFFMLAFFSWFFDPRYFGFLYSFFQIALIFLLSFFVFQKYYIFLDGFILVGISFLGSFLGSFYVEKKEIKLKSLHSQSLRAENIDSNRDNTLFIKVLKEIDEFVDESRFRLEASLLKQENYLQFDMKKLIKERSRIAFSHVKGLYHYVLALEKTGICETTFELKWLVLEILKSFEEKVIAKEIQIDLQIKDSVQITTDLVLFQAIVYNIVFNAIKYTYEKTVIKISYEEECGRFCFNVCDQGPGFSSFEGEVKNFIPNLEKESKTNFAAKGYGLGLYLSQVIAEKIELDFWVTKNENFNSIFKIFFKNSKK